MLPVVTAQDNQLIGRIPLENLPELTAPFQWFAFVSLADLLPGREPAGDGQQPGHLPRLSRGPGAPSAAVEPRWSGGYDGPARP